MVSLERQQAAENPSGDSEEMDLELKILDSDDVDDRELQVEEETHHEQAKKIVEVDNVIAEKEEILTKLLDTVRGYSAMKVRAIPRILPNTHEYSQILMIIPKYLSVLQQQEVLLSVIFTRYFVLLLFVLLFSF